MVDITPDSEVPVVIPVNKPVSLIPVGLKEAGLDSPTFRASAAFLGDQVDAVEKWLDGLVKISSKLAQEAATLSPLLSSFATHCRTSQHLSEAILDHDYTLLAIRRLAEGGAQDIWSRAIESIRKTQSTVAEPIRQFLQTEIRPFKEARRSLEYTQKAFDTVLLRSAGQSKTKESSSLREDAFQVHEARRAYLKASMDFCVLGPQVRAALDTLLIKISCEQWDLIKGQSYGSEQALTQQNKEMGRIRAWSKQMAEGERYLRHQLLAARRQIEDEAERVTRPSRDLDSYSLSTVTYLGSGPPPNVGADEGSAVPSSKQGWLFLRTLTGKPTRTHWLRRWFFVKDGIFGSLVHGARSGGVEESEKVGVLLCGVRPAFQEERRFCFEVKTKDTTILLQAETQDELMAWMSAFEKAKQKAIEQPASADAVAGSSGNPSSDAAFAVSPAVSHELATKRPDGQVTTMTEDPSASLLSAEGEPGADLGSRSSFDVSSVRNQASEREKEGSRDHATRILQKLDIHKKTNVGPQLSSLLPGTPSQSSGISSLIAASHGAMPIGPGRQQSAVGTRSVSQSAVFSSTLAPTTLVNPPSTTNLTKTAIRVGVDRGLDLGVVDEKGGIPSSLMANNWGSAAYGHQARLERGEVDTTSQASFPSVARRASDPTEDGSATMVADASVSDKAPPSPQPEPARHHKSASVMSLPGIQESSSSIEYPSYYPVPLKAHDAQFRMLFPNVAQTERVVMVFRASWTVGEGHDLPGRIFVTPKDLYFYSNHLGLVLVFGAALENISEITCIRGADSDVLQLHMIDRNGRDDVLVMKTFIDNPRLFKNRLEYLISNYVSENVDGLDTVLNSLVRVEAESRTDPDSDGTVGRQASRRTGVDSTTRLRVDRSLPTGGDMIDASDNARFLLPSQPVKYVPNGMSRFPTTERTFDISAKALLHIIFGDKSAIYPVLYQQRGAKTIRQHPWTKREDDGYLSRAFEYETSSDTNPDLASMSVTDSQSLDVASDHLCYLITDLKVPVHLPRPTDYTLVSKIAVTYETKTKCKLSIYTKVDWISTPWFSKGLIEGRALEDLEVEALGMVGLVAEQVQRLGFNPSTKKVVDIYGKIGQQSEAAQVSSKHDFPRGQLTLRKRTIRGLFIENARSLFQSCCTTVLMSIIGVVRLLLKGISVHSVLVTLLVLSISFSALQSSDYAKSWWQERSTTTFMARMGVGPNLSMSKSIYLRDMADGIRISGSPVANSSNDCSNTFGEILASTNYDAPMSSTNDAGSPSTRSTARRLRRTRQRLATYRHNILVALRLINNIERETTQAEYENWLLDETVMCDRMSSRLQPKHETVTAKLGQSNTTSTPDQGVSSLVKQLGAEDADKVQKWYESYCESCRNEKVRLGM